jgi:hypothetical protein
MQLNVCFDTDNRATLPLPSPALNSSTIGNRELNNEKQIHIELVNCQSPVIAQPKSSNESTDINIEPNASLLAMVESNRS